MPTGSSDEGGRPVSGAEFDAALARAEHRLGHADQARCSINRYRVGIAAGWSISAIALLALLRPGASGLVVGTLTVVVVAANMLATWRIRDTAMKQLMAAIRRDERYAAETVGLLRETLPFLARDEGWSMFRLEESRLRIGRFPIRGGRP